MPGLLGNIYSFGDKLKRQVNGLLADPVATAQQFAGNQGDRARGLLDMTNAATDEFVRTKELRGPAQAQLDQVVADAYNPAGMTWVAPNKIDKNRMNEITSYMKENGPPQLRAFFDGEKYIALEGSHRIHAAKELGITPIPIEMSAKEWLLNHDLYDLPEKTSVARALTYLGGTGPHVNFDDL